MKTPPTQRAASRKKLAAMGQALPGVDGQPPSFPIPNLDYLRRAIKSVGRAPASKRPALKALIRKRAAELKATSAPGVKGTWPFQGANDGEAIELAFRYKHGWIKIGGAADEHVANAKRSDAEGRHSDAINHLTAAISHTTDKSAAFHLTELQKEMAARQMGVPYKAKPLPKRLHAMENGSAVSGGEKAAHQKPGPDGLKIGTDAPADVQKAANALTMDPRKTRAAAMPTAQLRAVNKELARTATALGHPGELSTAHKVVQAELKRRAAGGKSAVTAANDTEALEMAMTATRKMPMIRGAADVQLSRTGPGQIMARHKSSGMKIGTITPQGKGWMGTHGDGKATGASGSQQGALTGLIAYHNQMAAKAKAAQPMAGAKTYTAPETDAVDLAGALPASTPAVSSMDGPRVTSMGAGKPAKTAKPAGSPSGLSPYGMGIYRKFLAKKMKPAVAMAFAKRADAMHAKAA